MMDPSALLKSPLLQAQMQGMQQAMLTAQLFRTGKLMTATALTAVDAVLEVQRLVDRGCLPWGAPVPDPGGWWVIFYFEPYNAGATS